MRTQIGAVRTLGEIGLNHADLSLRAALSVLNKATGARGCIIALRRLNGGRNAE